MKRLGGLSSFAALLAALTLLSGCVTATPRLDGFAADLERALPGSRFEPEMGFKLGRLATGFARGITGMAIDEDDNPDAQQALTITRGIRRVEIASFIPHNLGEGSLVRFDGSLHRAGWQTLARVRADHENTWILYRGNERRIRSLLIATLSEDELVLVRLEGRLEKIVPAALELARSNRKKKEVEEESEPAEPPEPAGQVADAATGH